MMANVISQQEWQSHQMVKQVVIDDAGESIPIVTILPANAGGNLPWVVAVHGYTSRKEEWLEFDDYTKGGNLTKALVDRGIAVVVIDLYFHGEKFADASIDYDNLLSDESDQWEPFFYGTVKNIETVIKDLAGQDQFDADRLGFMSYSLGGLFGFWLANRHTWFKSMVLCVPPVGRDKDDEFISHNNLNSIADVSIMLAVAEQDKYAPLEDSRWLYEKLPVVDKQFYSYDSDHSLPEDYVPVAARWFKDRL
jgi:dienelactone hydrolase